jgi:hypothetical protein
MPRENVLDAQKDNTGTRNRKTQEHYTIIVIEPQNFYLVQVKQCLAQETNSKRYRRTK